MKNDSSISHDGGSKNLRVSLTFLCTENFFQKCLVSLKCSYDCRMKKALHICKFFSGKIWFLEKADLQTCSDFLDLIFFQSNYLSMAREKNTNWLQKCQFFVWHNKKSISYCFLRVGRCLWSSATISWVVI